MEWKKLLCAERPRDYHKPSTSYDRRSEFQMDYHRIIGSASFRRLQDKTQVFPLDRSDFIRTRLTHSLEVSSFAKSLGQTVFKSIEESGADESVTPQVREDACAILECAGLIHDIGNPPFGHFGEDCIRSWFRQNLCNIRFCGKEIRETLSPQMYADLCSYEGNAQALRIVSKLHFLVDEYGMNLTFALLNTIIKYPVSSLETDKKSGDIRTKKMGYYWSENELFGRITEHTGAVGVRYPLVYILEAADDIAYKTADIEDAVKKGFIDINTLKRELEEIFERECAEDPGFADSAEGKSYASAVSSLGYYLGKANEKKLSAPEQNAVSRWIISVQNALLKSASEAFTSNYRDIMDGCMRTDLLEASDSRLLAFALSDIAYRYVFSSKTIYKLEIAAHSTLFFLLGKFVPAAVRFDSGEASDELDERLMALVSENYIRAYRIFSRDKSEEEKLYLRLLLAADYICGMTDSFAKRLHRELSGIM